MPRYDERSGATRLYVGHISSRTRTRDLEDLFGKYGRVRDVDMKQDFAFVNFSDSRDADEARHFLNGRTFDGSRITVEFARGGPRGGGRGGGGSSRDYTGARGPPPGTGRCYNCGNDGHWARDCKAGDWKNKCYRCGQRGHIERNCQSSPRGHRSRSRSRSRSPAAVRRRSPSRSYDDRSRSPPPRKADSDRSPVAEKEQSERAHGASRSQSMTPQKGAPSRSPSPSVNGRRPAAEKSPQSRGSGSASPNDTRGGEGDDCDGSPMKDSASPTHSGGE